MNQPPAGAIHAIVPAGGAGTRLWPLSRRAAPKFLRDLTGSGATLLQQTVARLAPVATGITVVTGRAHAETVRAQLARNGSAATWNAPAARPAGDVRQGAVGRVRVIAEPSPRNSMAAIGLAAALVEADPSAGPQAVVGSFAADHVIGDDAAFHAAVRQAVALAETGLIATLGIAPRSPSTAFGYIRQGARLAVPGAPQGRAVEAFVEKPDAQAAHAYLEQGGHSWNAGMFVARAGVLLDVLARRHPQLAAGLRQIAADVAVGPGTAGALEASLDAHWAELEMIAIDHAVAEPAAAEGLLAVVPVEMGWDDLGDVASLADHLPVARASRARVGADRAGEHRDRTDEHGDSTGRLGDDARVLGDHARVHTLDAARALVAPAGRDVIVLGIDDAVVLDTGDALLVTTRAHAQRVKDVTTLLDEAGRDDLL